MKPEIVAQRSSTLKCLVILTFLSTCGALQALQSDPLQQQQQQHRATEGNLKSTPRFQGTSTPSPRLTGILASAGLQPTRPAETDPTTATINSSATSPKTVGPDNNLIQSTLFRIESLNFSNHQQQQQHAANRPLVLSSHVIGWPVLQHPASKGQQPRESWASDASDELEDVASEQPASEAPTDSGEDPLETSPSMIEQQQASSTQYSIAMFNGPSSQLNPTTDQSLDATASEDERRLVDSNNVSAMLAPPKDLTLTLLNTADLGYQLQVNSDGHNNRPLTTIAPNRQPISCDQAYNKCALRNVCEPALKAYNNSCQDLIYDRTSQCSVKCLKVMIALRSSEEGDDLINCDCQGDEYCLQRKQSSKVCRPQVEEAVDPKTIVSCSKASWICMADQLCSTALEYYYRFCQSSFSQGHCSMRCNNSLSILYRQPKASKLVNCHCDGSEEFPCVKYKTLTERLCLNKSLSPTTDEPQMEEDLELNMTNDSETFVLASPPSLVNEDNYHSAENKEEYEDSREAAGDEESPQDSTLSAGSNGIQPIAERGYIPLVSGRFFNNLSYQQQRAQQQPQNQKQTNHNRQQQVLSQQQQQQQQQQRKSHKNVKQKSKLNNNSGSVSNDSYHGARRRYSRILMFASSSSSALGHRELLFSSKSLLLLSTWITMLVVAYTQMSPSPVVSTRLLLH